MLDVPHWGFSLVFDTSSFRISVVYIFFEAAKNIHVLQVLIGALEDAEGSLLGVWNLDLDLDIVKSLRYTLC